MGFADAIAAETQSAVDSAARHEARLRERSQEETELKERLSDVLQRQNEVRRRCVDATRRLQAGRGLGRAQTAGGNGAQEVTAANGEEETAHREALLRGLSRTQLRAVLRRKGLPPWGRKDDLVARALGALVWAGGAQEWSSVGWAGGAQEWNSAGWAEAAQE